MDLSIIFPAHNEEKRIAAAIEKTANYLQDNFMCPDCELIIVENGSTDKTKDIATAAALDLARAAERKLTIKLEHSPPGKGAAIRHGLRIATGRIILITDVDLSTPIDEILKLLREIIGEADLVIGSRKLPGSNVSGLTGRRRLTSDIFTALAMPLTPGIIDTQCGFKMLTIDLANRIEPLLTLDGFAIDVELIHAARENGYNIKEIPVNWIHNNNSTVKIIRDSFRMARDLFIIWVNHARGQYMR